MLAEEMIPLPTPKVLRAAGRLPVWTAAVMAAGILALSPTARAAPNAPAPSPRLRQMLIATLHLRVTSVQTDGTIIGVNPQGFRYTIIPAQCRTDGPCGVSFVAAGRPAVTLAQATRDAASAGFRLIPPAALPAGTRLVDIGESAPTPGRPMSVSFEYRVGSGAEFTIDESRAPGVTWGRGTPHWQLRGTEVVLLYGASPALPWRQQAAIRLVMALRSLI